MNTMRFCVAKKQKLQSDTLAREYLGGKNMDRAVSPNVSIGHSVGVDWSMDAQWRVDDPDRERENESSLASLLLFPIINCCG